MKPPKGDRRIALDGGQQSQTGMRLCRRRFRRCRTGSK